MQFSILLATPKRRPLSSSVVKTLVFFQQQLWNPTVSDGSKLVFFLLCGFICIMQMNNWYGSSPLRWTFLTAICQASNYLLTEWYYTGNCCKNGNSLHWNGGKITQIRIMKWEKLNVREWRPAFIMSCSLHCHLWLHFVCLPLHFN